MTPSTDGDPVDSIEHRLLEELPVMYVETIGTDPEAVISVCNERFAAALGYDRTALHGTPLVELYTDESAASFREGGAYERALRDEFIREERTFVASDGSHVHTLVRAVPRHADGEVVGTKAIYVDVTPLERQRARYESLITRAKDVVAVFDTKSHICSISQSATDVLGYDPDTLIGRCLEGYVHEADRERVLRAFRNVVGDDDTTTERVEFRFQHANGAWIWLEAVATDARDESVDGIVATAHDVTRRKQREQYLRVLNRVMRHNLRNDVNLIDGHASLIADATDDEHVAESLAVIQDVAERWRHLSEKAAKVRHLYHDNSTESHASVTETIDWVLERLGSDPPGVERQLTITCQPSKRIPFQIRHALRELCENAIIHTRDADTLSATIEIRAVDHPDRDDWVRLSVADRGSGIPEQERRVLEGGEETPLVHGSGLGCWLVNMLVTGVGGEVSVDVDSGTVVRIDIPVVGRS